MSEKNKNLPFAFPSEFKNTDTVPLDHYGYDVNPGVTAYHQGMTLRDYFAAKAMQGVLTDPSLCIGTNKIKEMDEMAIAFYSMADAMLIARGE